ncbi:E3 ubiquitin-protein ligase RNF14-like isoform X3 [Corythoichthys intestinalis]|uniref:E3 ubiquitin-protein ligase RNF14-like isoform X3 n=1 Tax=Corythoichthys intestinalis TaxID=161448 RepID=UPI0025A57086|nr:E3 ubiquitin-protein ligase RNF14-like isoform X3 [Corythoichthys intestinalis]
MAFEEQENELLALQSIFGSEDFIRHESKSAGEIRVSVELPSEYKVALREGGTLKQYKISFLPTLLLTFELPENYPYSSPPDFTLCCSWLTQKQLADLGTHLTELYNASRGDVVLFSWVQFLREDTIRFLNITSMLELSNEPSTSFSSQGTMDVEPSEQENSQTTGYSHPRSLSDDKNEARDPLNEHNPFSGLSLTPSQTLLSKILIHDAAQEQKVFQSTVYDCAVCFISYLGSECIKIQECGHVFCRSCLAEYCKVQITEGNVRGVTCAQEGCTALPAQAQVQSLVGEELFKRYDRLLLQSTLDHVIYCPRTSCASPVIIEKDGNVALCSICGFAFCTSCKKAYHGTNDCELLNSHPENDSEQSIADLPRSLEGMKALWEDYASGSKQRRRLLESRYGGKGRFPKLEDYLSGGWIALNSKNCPYCSCKIEKNGGCNIVTCSQCDRHFCWICLTVLSGRTYQHFQSSECYLYL